MSTGRRLAKRSIIGTRVCAQGPDGLWYSGIIQDVKTPLNKLKQQQIENNNCINLTLDTRYCVRFNFKTIYENQQQEQLLNNCHNNNNESMDNSDIIMMDTSITNNIINQDHEQQQQQQQHQLQQQQQQQQIQLQQQQQQHQLQQHQQCINILINPAQSLRHNAMIKEYRESELIGPGFRSIMGVQLLPGQKVFLTHNGRETSGNIINHDLLKDDVTVKIMAIGSEEPLELKKRLEEVRLLESRRSARLADQDRDTDFARLADMAGDRRRTSHSIDVPLALTPQHNSRKRRPSCSQDERDQFLPLEKNEMEACNAALVLMSLSCSPRSPSAGQWNTGLGSSPGSSSASWSSGSSSPPLSDDGTQPPILVDANGMARLRTTSVSTSDEGIVMDYSDDGPRKRKANGPIFKCTWKGCGVIELTVDKIEKHVRNAHLGPKKPRHSYEDDGTFSDSDHEEEFYYTEEDDTDEGKAPSPPSPPTLSHRDMARPPHEDPEYQRQIVGNFKQGLLALTQSPRLKSPHHIQTTTSATSTTIHNAGPINIPTSPLAHHNYTWAAQPPHSPVKHARWSPRPSTSSAPYPSPPYIHYNNNQHHHHHHQQQQQQQQHQQQQKQHHQQQHHVNNYNNSNSSNSSVGSNNSSNIVTNHSSDHNNLAITNHRNNHHNLTTTGLSHSAPNSVTTSATLSLSPNIHHHPITQNNSGNNNNNNISQQQQHQIPTSSLQSSVLQQTNGTGTSIISTGVAAGGTTNQHQLKYYTSSSSLNNINASSGGGGGGNHRSPQSPNRRTRGENKKCRKVYGMERKDQWCTQCKWKKACSRFGD